MDQLFLALNLKGNIDLVNPETKLTVIELYEENFEGSKKGAYNLLRIYFGTQIGQAQHLATKYNLTERACLGPTSTDATLAFLMANAAKVQKGDFVLDPFVGSGSLLVAAAHYGAICFGSDLDERILQGWAVGRINQLSSYAQSATIEKKKQPQMWINFQQYQLAGPDLIQSNCTRLAFRSGTFDSIICDPPYGDRAMCRKQIRRKETDNDNVSSNILKGKGPTEAMSPAALIREFCINAHDWLAENGRLVFLYPVDRSTYRNQPDDFSFYDLLSNLAIPNSKVGLITQQIPLYDLLDLSENPLTSARSRVLVTLQKYTKIAEEPPAANLPFDK